MNYVENKFLHIFTLYHYIILFSYEENKNDNKGFESISDKSFL